MGCWHLCLAQYKTWQFEDSYSKKRIILFNFSVVNVVCGMKTVKKSWWKTVDFVASACLNQEILLTSCQCIHTHTHTFRTWTQKWKRKGLVYRNKWSRWGLLPYKCKGKSTNTFNNTWYWTLILKSVRIKLFYILSVIDEAHNTMWTML